MPRDIVFTPRAAKPTAASSRAVRLPARIPGLKVCIAAIATAAT
jgi:hypothetical protein